jgi:hypothetical protein
MARQHAERERSKKRLRLRPEHKDAPLHGRSALSRHHFSFGLDATKPLPNGGGFGFADAREGDGLCFMNPNNGSRPGSPPAPSASAFSNARSTHAF